MGDIKLVCGKCHRVYQSGVHLGSNATATLHIDTSQCPFCGELNKMPEGTFRGTVDGFISIVNGAPDRVKELEDILDALKHIQSGSEPAAANPEVRKWLPKDLKQVGEWILLVGNLLVMLNQNPAKEVDIQVINVISQQINVTQIQNQDSPRASSPSAKASNTSAVDTAKPRATRLPRRSRRPPRP